MRLSEKLWRLLNDASERCALNSNELCLLDEARQFVMRVEAAPVGKVTSFDPAGAWMVNKDDVRGIYPTMRGQRVRLVIEAAAMGRREGE